MADPAQTSTKSQRYRTPANAAADSPTSKRTPRANRTPNKTAGLEARSIQNKYPSKTSRQEKKIEAVVTEEVPPPRPEGGTPRNSKQRREVKHETEDTQEHKLPAGKPPKKDKKNSKIEVDQEPADLQIDGGTPKALKRKRIVKVEEAETDVTEPSPKKTKRKAIKAEIDETVEDTASPNKAKRKTQVKEEGEEVQEGEGGQKKTQRKRKTKEEKELEAMPLAVRTDGLRMFIGAHVSGAKGWSLSTYIASVELKFLFESRSSQFSHELRAHWVNTCQLL